MIDDAKTIGALAATVASSAGAGSVTVATITAPAPGILGVIGLTTNTTVALPIVGVACVTVVAGYGVYKGIKMAQKSNLKSIN